jgi:diguanylate cyclase (GGDEF)-like protein
MRGFVPSTTHDQRALAIGPKHHAAAAAIFRQVAEPPSSSDRWIPLRLLERARRDPLVLLSVAVAVPIAAMELGSASARVVATALALVVVLAQVGLGGFRAMPRSMPALRLALLLGYVLLVNTRIDASGTWPLIALQVPIVAMAAALGGEALPIVAVAIFITLIPLAVPGVAPDLRERALTISIAELVLAIGSRSFVASLERYADRLRAARAQERRRSRQVRALEVVGTLLAREGPTTATMERIVGLLDVDFGYRYPSIYVSDGDRLRLGASRGHAHPIERFDPSQGIIGRVSRTLEPAFVTDVRSDPDYVSGESTVVSEICAPMLSEGELVGVLDVESDAERRLDRHDLATLTLVADQLAAALALGRERQKLTERTRLMDRLVSFSQSLATTLDPDALHERVTGGALGVVPATMVVLVTGDPAAARYHVAGMTGLEPGAPAVEIQLGEGITGRAIAERTVVVDGPRERDRFPAAAAGIGLTGQVMAMAAPLFVDQEVVGAIAWFRNDDGSVFSEQEREIAALLAGAVALALTNADLHHVAQEAAITDPLTGLRNRRHFDAVVQQDDARRERIAGPDRGTRSAVMFDLDHFGEVNKRHGHQVGDQVLRGFGRVLAARARTADLVARYGGEEFAVILDGSSRDGAQRLAEDVRRAFAGVRFRLPDGTDLGCTVSAGVAGLEPGETETRLLLERADVGLAMAKAAGRNLVVAA